MLPSKENNLLALIFATEGMINLYKHYHDMVILDTTFGLNRFNMPVLTLAGVNNEGGTIILGFAFLQDETYKLKKWVLETYKGFVDDVQPDAVISDACPALLKALQEAFPDVRQYLCSWHVQLNIKRHFSGFKRKLKSKSMIYFSN